MRIELIRCVPRPRRKPRWSIAVDGSLHTYEFSSFRAAFMVAQQVKRFGVHMLATW